ncbi:MAG: thiamine pyrophosphate-dependent enzyme [Candidatus Omnitrophota bacterium]
MHNPKLKKIAFLSGDEAVAQAAYEEGLEFAASYPGTPATEILEYLAGFREIDSQWSVNEKVAFEVALASAIAGRRSLFAAKHVGLNVAMDPLMTSAYVGVLAGFLIVSCDDPGLHSSQNEQDNRYIAKMAKLPLFELSSPSEAREFVSTAFKLSESFDTPVILRLTTRVAHSKQDLLLGERKTYARKAFKPDAAKYVMVPRNALQRHIVLEKRIEKLERYAESSPLNKVEIKNRKLGFVSGSVAYLYAKEMYPDASFLKLGMSFPFPSKKVKEFAAKVKELVIVEELEPFLEEQVRMLGLKIKTKHPSFRIGELRPEYIPYIMKGKEKPKEAQLSRRPVMCPGCSHRPVFSVLKKLKLVVSGDIGCYTLAALPPLNILHSCLCMGAGITFFEGFKRTLKENVVGVIGDSTFVHSGIPGLINLSYNQTKGLVIILDNATTAMTGNQPHPATGKTIQGKETKKLILEDICRASGADNVDVVDPHNIAELEGIIKKRLNEESLSVLIARSPCRLLGCERTEPPIYKKEGCKKCYICLSLDCPALKKTEDGFIQINQNTCVGCNLCVEFCKFQALVKNEK